MPKSHVLWWRWRKEVHMLLSNILEMVMCRAFQSLPGFLIEEYFGLLPDGREYSNLGLNIAHLWYRGSAFPHKRRTFTLHLTVSKDPEIQNWPAVRSQQQHIFHESVAKKSFSLLTQENYQRAVQSALAEKRAFAHFTFVGDAPTLVDSSFNLTERFKRCARALQNLTGELPILVSPVGNREARIGIILDYEPLSITIANNKKSIAANLTALPWGLEEAGFTPLNSFIWSFNHQNCDLFDGSITHIKLPTPQEALLPSLRGI